jgi:S-disulfanyl-L-cysteine oxidoreductase SoxD
MSMRKIILPIFVLAAAVPVATADDKKSVIQAPSLGTPLSADDLKKWDLTVFPDGRGLPSGQGTAARGRELFDSMCARCHGEGGQGATAEELVGPPDTPTADNPQKTIGAYWPSATTVFDFIRRNKPPENAGSLSSDDIYALTAYLLSANKVIGDTETMSADTLPKVKMPNRDGFIRIDAP